MNEELAKRLIGIASDSDFTKNKLLWSDGMSIYYKEHMIRLIELVVEECISVVNDQPWSDPHEVYQAMELIQNHFGVKE